MSNTLPIRHLYVTNYLVVVLIVNLLSVLSVEAAVCSPKIIAEADFIWQKGEQMLPANAKGVLFRIAPLRPMYVYDTSIVHNDYFLSLFRDHIDSLKPNHFAVYEKGANKQLTATVTRLKFKDMVASEDEDYFRYLQVDFQTLSCASKLYARTKSNCALLGNKLNRQLRASSPKIIKNTEEVKKGAGLFRIGAQEGFKPGHTYTIEFLGMPGYWNLEKTKQSYRQPKSLTIKIDEQDFDLNSFNKLRFTTKPNANDAQKNDVYYAYDAKQKRYQDAFYSLITVNGEGYVQQLEYLPKPKEGCHLTPYLWNKTFNQTGIYAVDEIVGQSHRVQGRIGFFEVEDAVFKTQETRFESP